MAMTLNRRDVMRGMISGAVSLALAPGAIAQFGPAPGVAQLSSNENPYGPGPKALKAAAQALHKGAYYPGRVSRELMNALAERRNVSTDNIFLCSGSNEGLQAAYVAYGKKGKVLMPDHTYSVHLGYTNRVGVELARAPMNEDLSINLDALADAVDDSISMVYICNPNNPTGGTLDGDELRDFCRTVGKKAVVVVDEAYNELTDDPEYTSVVDLVRDGENVLVLRTFSKIFGMAGLRVGYGIGNPAIKSYVGGHVMAWPNVVGLAAAHASCTDDEFIAFSRNKILEGREMVIETFRRNGIEPLPSQTNFIYADIGRDATEFQKKMAKHKVVIRQAYQPYTTYSRVSMGFLEDLERFDDVFTKVYRGA